MLLPSRFSALILALSLSGVTQAQQAAFPNKPVKIVIPYASGGANDLTFRMIGAELAPVWGQPLIVETKPGGAGRLAFESVARSAPDGYTLVNSVSSLTTMPYLFKDLTFDPRQDLVGVMTILRYNPSLVVTDAIPARNLQEFFAYAKANPGKINYGAQGYGNIVHLTLELISRTAGIETVGIMYPGSPQMIEAGIRGDIQMLYINDQQFSQAPKGKFRALAVTTDQRSEMWPDVPTLKETGQFEFIPYSWIGVSAPKGTPKPVIDKISADIAAVFRKPGFGAAVLRASGASGVHVLGPDAFNQLLRSEFKNWGDLTNKIGIKPQ